MTVNKNYKYGCDVDTLFDHVTDEAALTSKYESCGAKNISFTQCDSEGDTRTVKWQRDMPADPPGFAKKFMSEWNTLVEELVWSRSGDEIKGKYTGQVKGVPGNLWGDFTIKADGAGCCEMIAMGAEVKVPLVGKKIAALVEQDVDSNLDGEDSFHKSQLG